MTRSLKSTQKFNIQQTNEMQAGLDMMIDEFKIERLGFMTAREMEFSQVDSINNLPTILKPVPPKPTLNSSLLVSLIILIETYKLI